MSEIGSGTRTTAPEAVSHRRSVLVLAAIVLLNVALSGWNTVTRAPWWDEGILVSPAYNLAHHGYLGTTVQHGRGLVVNVDFPQYDRYTYWALPAYLLALAGWIRVFGASIIATRALSMLMGAVLVVAWYLIVRRLVASRAAGLIAATFVAVDATVITAASNTRMDCMTAALGACGVAAYLALRQKRHRLALLTANTFAALALLTHPTGAIQVLASAVLVLSLDRRELRWSDVPLILAPYVLLLSGWGVYVLQAPGVAAGQMHAQAGHRVGGILSPFRALLVDASERYWCYFYTAQEGIRKAKALLLLEYVLGIVLSLAVSALRRNRGVRALLSMAIVSFAGLAVIDGMKSPHYLLLTCTVFAALWGVAMWQIASAKRAVVLIASAFFLIQVAGTVQRARADAFHKSYLPVIEFLRANNAGYSAPVIGASELWFGLGPEAKLLDDMRLGYYSGWQPKWIVTNNFYGDAFTRIRREEPAVWNHVKGVMGRFDRVFSTEGFTVYRER